MEKDIVNLFNSLVGKLRAEGRKFSIEEVWNYCLLLRDDNLSSFHESEETIRKIFSKDAFTRSGFEKDMIELYAKKLNVNIEGNEQLIWDTFQKNFIENGYVYHITNAYNSENIGKVGLNVYERGEIDEKFKEVCERIKSKKVLSNIFGKGSVDLHRYYYSAELHLNEVNYGNVPEWFNFLAKNATGEYVQANNYNHTKEEVMKNIIGVLRENNESEEAQKSMAELINMSWDKYVENQKRIIVAIPNSKIGIMPIDGVDVKEDFKGEGDTKKGLEILFCMIMDCWHSSIDSYSDKEVKPENLIFIDTETIEATRGKYRVIGPIEAQKNLAKIQKRKEKVLDRKLNYEVMPKPAEEVEEMIDYYMFTFSDGLKGYWEKLEEKGIIDEVLKQDEEIQNDNKQYKSNLHGVNHTRRVNFLANAIMMDLRDSVSERDKEIVFAIIKNHDIGRVDDWKDNNHGENSVKLLEENPERLKGFSPEEQELIKFAIREHCYSKEQNEKDLIKIAFGQDTIPENASKESMQKYENYKKILHIIEDADRLDRVRLDPRGENKREGLDASYLNLFESKSLVKLAYESYGSVLEMMYLSKEEKKLKKLYPEKTAKLFDVEKTHEQESV